MAEITRGERIVLQLMKDRPTKFRALYPLLTTDKAKLVALKMRAATKKGK